VFDWDMIGIGGLTTTYGYVKDACRLAKKVNSDALLTCGGGVITAQPHDVMKGIPEIDLAFIGEAFVSFPVVLKKIDQKNYNFKDVLGIAYRNTNGECVLNQTAPLIKDLDSLPYPAWDLLPLDIYFENSQSLGSEELYTSKRRIDLNGSLGCSLVCRYCWHLGTTGDMVIEEDETGKNDVKFSYGRTIRYHSPAYMFDAVEELVNRHHIFINKRNEVNIITVN
jgi:radical SAM superfamily enzyme YgiQ (UPF0313 family)